MQPYQTKNSNLYEPYIYIPLQNANSLARAIDPKTKYKINRKIICEQPKFKIASLLLGIYNAFTAVKMRGIVFLKLQM